MCVSNTIQENEEGISRKIDIYFEATTVEFITGFINSMVSIFLYFFFIQEKLFLCKHIHKAHYLLANGDRRKQLKGK